MTRTVGTLAVAGQHRRMRYEPSQRLLRLALMLAGTRTGLTLDEMARELAVTRRTAERLRDGLAELFPALECWDDDARVRRWRLPGAAFVGIAEPRAEAVAAVGTLARECTDRGEADRALLLRDAAATLRALMRPAALLRADLASPTACIRSAVTRRPPGSRRTSRPRPCRSAEPCCSWTV